jgi:hypothetical protein
VRKVEERLRRTFLFSDAVTNHHPVLAGQELHHHRPACRRKLPSDDPEHLHLVGKGRLSMGDKEGAPVLGKGEFWGSDSLFQSMSPNAA